MYRPDQSLAVGSDKKHTKQIEYPHSMAIGLRAHLAMVLYQHIGKHCKFKRVAISNGKRGKMNNGHALQPLLF